MTHNARVNTLTSALLLAAAIILIAPATLAAPTRQDVRTLLERRPGHLWWSVYSEPPTSLSRYLVPGVGFVLTAAVSLYLMVRLRTLFSRAAAPEAFFLLLFLGSLSAEALRAVALLLFAGGAPMPFQLLISRALYSVRLFGTFAVFMCSLYALGIQYPRVETPLALMIILCLLFGYNLPVDTSVFLASLSYGLGDESAMAALFLSLYGFALVNMLLAALRSQDRSFLLQALAVGLALAGREVTHFAPNPLVSGAGFAALMTGAALYTRVLYRRSYVI